MTSIHMTDLIPAYALGALDETERAGVERHLAACSACQAELRAYSAVVDQLPLAVPLQAPPLRLRASLLQRAAAQSERDTRLARAGWRSWFAWLARPLNPLVGLVSLLLVIVLGAVSLNLWQQLQRPPAMAGEFRLVQLASPQQNGATGLLIISENGSFGTLVVDGLTALQANQQYQLWLIKDGKRTSGGVFSVQDNGYGMLRVESPQPLNSYPSFGVTIEPAGGSPGPTGPKVLGGTL